MPFPGARLRHRALGPGVGGDASASRRCAPLVPYGSRRLARARCPLPPGTDSRDPRGKSRPRFGGSEGPKRSSCSGIRLPSLLTGLLVGGGAGGSGALMQGALRNPLADPRRSVSSGAGLSGGNHLRARRAPWAPARARDRPVRASEVGRLPGGGLATTLPALRHFHAPAAAPAIANQCSSPASRSARWPAP